MRRIIAIILALAASFGLAAVFSPAALADGDPASDVLAFKPVFNPYDSGATPEQAAELVALVRYVSAHGYPLKVAMVASSADLGTVTQLWENAGGPNGYAQYVGRELALVFTGNLLVVMPETDGLYVPVALKSIPKGDTEAMGGLAPAGSQLVQSAYAIVQRLARDNGVRLPTTLASAAVPRASNAGSSSATPLVCFFIGLFAIAAAWGLSLRVRPLRPRAVA